ncbi:hypothetical protein ACFSX9_02910 [Flavobacterium ardleyense]|uniref:Uncharacterized protein n=1 Tax=Flavobacterium ardleyense TaxID=2038737 RepID=A0ABW5Z4X0_9FLAO
MKYKTLLLIASIFLSSYKDKNFTDENKYNGINHSISFSKFLNSDEKTPISGIDQEQLDSYCDSLKTNKQYIIDLLDKNASVANNIKYENYKTNRKRLEEELFGILSPLIEKYINLFHESNSKAVVPKDFKLINKKLKSVDIETWYIGEGITELRTVPSHYYKLFKNIVSVDYKDFIKQETVEEESLYSSDGGIVVSFEEVGNRVAFWEKFISKYPSSSLLSNAKERYLNYLSDFLFGLDNTPTFENNIIYPEILNTHNSFIRKYPKSETSRKINELKSLLTLEINNSDEYRKIIFKETNF